MAFRLLDQLPQYTLADGTLCAGGSLTFSISGGSTAKSVFQEPALSTDLGNVITLDSDGRHSEDLWLAEDVAYRVILRDADGATIWTRDEVRSLDATVSVDLPDASDGTDGQALFTDGTAGGWYFDDVLTIPSMTGNADKYLTNDGVILLWRAFTDDVATTVEATASSSGSIVIGDVMIQWGTDTAPIPGSGLTTTKAVTFGTAFSGTPYHIGVCPALSSGVTSNTPSGYPAARYSSPSTTGFTAGFFVGEENTGGTDAINATIPFTFFAIGPA